MESMAPSPTAFHSSFITSRLTSAEVIVRTAPVNFCKRDEANKAIVCPTEGDYI